MIATEKHDPAHRALHAIFVGLRELARTGAPHGPIQTACDVGELLPTLFLREDDQTAHFRAQLIALTKQDPIFELALDYFDEVDVTVDQTR